MLSLPNLAVQKFSVDTHFGDDNKNCSCGLQYDVGALQQIKKSAKKAILVVSFGTTYQQTREKTIGAIEAKIKGTFPDFVVRRAFTSGMVVSQLRKEEIFIDTVEEAVEKLAAEGFHTLICQPTHIINGLEFERILRIKQQYEHRFESFYLGRPLLSSPEDYTILVSVINKEVLPILRKEEAFLFMGHGTTHFANSAYAALSYQFLLAGMNRVLLATVESKPSLQDVIHQLQKLSVKKVFLAPLMVVAGEHAYRDMAGSDRNSWINILNEAGFKVEIMIKGLGEYPGIQEIYVNHIRDIFTKI